MSLQANKDLAATFIEAMRTSNGDQLAALTTADFSWWILGEPAYLATAGEHNRDFFLGFFAGEPAFAGVPTFDVIAMIAEGDRVAVEARLEAITSTGTRYRNAYHFSFVIEDGKIKRMREYMDTHHAKVVFGL